MRRRKSFLAGIIVLLSATCVVTAPEWKEPYFAKPDPLDDRVTWSERDTTSWIYVTIWEGVTDEVILTRLTYQQDGGTTLPSMTFSGPVGLGLTLKTNDDSTNPVYLQASEAGDFDTGTSTFLILLTSSQFPTRFVNIQLENVNDNAPIIESPQECSFDEEKLYGEEESKCIFTVTDIDGGACFVTPTINDDHFDLYLTSEKSRMCTTATFALRVIDELDFEKYRLHSLQIEIQDDGIINESPLETIHGEPQVRTVTFVVNVNDIPDEAPIWEILVPYISVNEKANDSQFEFRAKDGDFGLDWGIEYSLEFSAGYEEFRKYFVISDKGIFTIEPIDRDELQKEIFNVIVVATEIPDYEKYPNFVALDVKNTVVIMVNDLNDHEPEIKSSVEGNIFRIDEETSFNSGKSFTVVDPDLGENGQFNLKLRENPWSDNFILIPPSGYQTSEITITSIDASKLDYEDKDWRIITLTIEAEEVANKEHYTTLDLTIELIDLFDEPPEFDEEICSKIYNIEENQPKGYLVVRVEATDPDENDVVRYQLKNNYMAIDPVEGNINTINDNAFDYERQPEMVLQVIAYDTVNMRAFCEINIELIDLNDEPPTLVLTYSTDEILEHSPVGTLASGRIEATDPDEGASLEFKIDWDVSVAYKQGVAVKDKTLYESSVDLLKPTVGDNGESVTYLYVADSEKFDWEVFDSLKIQITVIDVNTHEEYLHNKERSAIMTVTVGDINDCEPVFTEESIDASFTVNENTDAGRLIGAVVATDDDSEPFSQINYSIVPESPEGLVSDIDNPRLIINEDTGQIYTTSTVIDCDEWQTLEFKYLVTATDGKFITSTSMTINIQDLNDNSPYVTEPAEPHYLEKVEDEHTPGSWEVGCIWGKDIDVTVDYHTITYYIEGTALNLFRMEEDCLPGSKCCLFVKVGEDMDREQQATHEIIVYSRDNYKLGIKDNSREGPLVTMRLILSDINDSPPVFENHKTFEVRENEELKNFKVEVTDADEGINAEFECIKDPVITVLRPEEGRDIEGVFEVDTEKDGCSVRATKSLEGFWGTYTFKLTAFDKGEGPNYGSGEYTLNVINVNLNAPVIVFPTEGQSFLIGRDQTVNGVDPLTDIYGEKLQDFEATDDDDPLTENGQVGFTLEGGENVFSLQASPTPRRAVLQILRIPEFGKREFKMSVIAKDKATLGPKESDEIFFTVWVLNSDSSPEFVELEPTIVKFYENETETPQMEILPAAVNLDEMPLEVKRPIYYFIIDGDTTLFTLDKTTRVLSLLALLDYEEATEHTLKILATHSSDPEGVPVYEQNILEVTIEVIDVNDMPPQFSEKLFPGTFSADQKVGQTILQLKAYDPDVDDKITYELIPGTMEAKDPSLQPFESDTTFLVDATTGIITLNFNPNGRVLSGYFEFQVQAYDNAGNKPGHRDEAYVNVFVVSDIHRVEFNFYNPVSVVETKQKEIEDVFSEVLGYTCVVEEMTTADTDSGADTTDVLTHFINNKDKSPVLRKTIEDEFMDEKTYRTLFGELSEYSLSFVGFSNWDTAKDNDSNTTTIVFATLSAGLGVVAFVLFLVLVVRTRTLNQRLDKLTKPKFGSQDSGLNRDGMVVPGTNIHALEGSNPVWNHDTVIDDMFDRMSRSSGDSDLIGIEDNPHFNDEEFGGSSNPAFQPQQSVDHYVMPSAPAPYEFDGPRRTSLNPLAAAAAVESKKDGFDSRSNASSLAMSLGDMDKPRRISLNPLVSDLDSELNAVEVDKKSAPVNSNFTFQLPPGEQVTDL